MRWLYRSPCMHVRFGLTCSNHHAKNILRRKFSLLLSLHLILTVGEISVMKERMCLLSVFFNSLRSTPIMDKIKPALFHKCKPGSRVRNPCKVEEHHQNNYLQVFSRLHQFSFLLFCWPLQSPTDWQSESLQGHKFSEQFNACL